MKKVIVTRHQALTELLRERHPELVSGEVLSHIADVEEVRGAHIIGVVPLRIAAAAAAVTEIPLSLSPEDRGRELPIERLRQIAGSPCHYVVREIFPCPAGHLAQPVSLAEIGQTVSFVCPLCLDDPNP